jgi:hypothetical protein
MMATPFGRPLTVPTRKPLIGRLQAPVTASGIPSNAFTLNGQPVLLNGRFITLTKAS